MVDTDNKKDALHPVADAAAETEYNELRLSAFLTATANSIYRMNPDWTILYAVDGKGFISDTGTAIDNWMSKYLLPEDQPIVQAAIDNAIAQKGLFELEHRMLRADGTMGWVFSRAVPMLSRQGEITEWLGTASDITMRKQAEAALERSRKTLEETKRLYEAMTSSTPDLVYIFDLNYRFIYANRALLEMWGRTEEEAMGRGLLEQGYEPWHAEMHEREIDHVVATKERIRGEVSFPHATLGKRIYDYIFSPLLNDKGDVYAVAGTTRDISELKMAEDALKRSEEQFRTLTQSLPQLTFTCSKEGHCDFFSQSWYDYTGKKPELSLGSGWMENIHPHHQDNMSGVWQASLDSGLPLDTAFQLRANDGSYKWFRMTTNASRDEQGIIRKWVGTLNNIDDQKAVEEELEVQVRERTRELQQSNADLLQFAHVASHDLKEPVRKTRTFANRLEKELGTALTEKGRLYLDKIYSATDRMNSMIEGVLAYATMDNVKQVNEIIDLTELLKSIADDLEVVIEQKNAVITYDTPHTVQGSRVLLYQLFYNLLNNSLKFAKTHEAPVITVTSEGYMEGDRESVSIQVKDNGIGFDPVYSEKIFQTFTRLHSKDQYEGTGLGLALCKKIVERHNGGIMASSEEGRGTTFTITLPVSA